MNLFKKIILVLLLISFNSSLFAQKKKSVSEKRAKAASEYVAAKMNLDANKKTFLYTVFLEKFKSTSKQIQGKDLSQEEKKAVYKQTNKVARKKMLEKFSSEEIKEINKYQQEANKLKK